MARHQNNILMYKFNLIAYWKKNSESENIFRSRRREEGKGKKTEREGQGIRKSERINYSYGFLLFI